MTAQVSDPLKPLAPNEMTRLVYQHDWSATPLGPRDTWPQSLRTAVQMILASPFPNIVLWGPQLVQIYNDGYRALMGNKHPDGLGQPTRACWPEVWHINQPIYEQILQGESLSFEDTRYPITRSGKLEDAWFTLSYSPIRDESDAVAGVLVSVFETTARLRAEAALRASEDKYRTQLHSTDEALRTSEEQYRALFHSIDEAVCTIDVLFDADGSATDYRFLEKNPLVEPIAGFTFQVGQTMRELMPDIDPHWIETVGSVARTGAPVRVEYPVASLGKWISAYMARVGGAGSSRVVCAYNDITDRKEREARQAYRLTLSDALRPVASPVDVQDIVTRTAMAYFHADRCYYCEIENGNAVIRRDAHRDGLPSVSGVYRLDDFALLKAAIETGRPFVVRDARTTDILDDALRQMCVSLQVISFINTPVIKDGQPVGTLCLVQSTPRDWTEREVELAIETAERTWTAVERTRAEDALRLSEQRLQLAAQVSGFGIHDLDLANHLLYWSPELKAMHGLAPDAVVSPDQFPAYIHPDDFSRATQEMERALSPDGDGSFAQEFRIRRTDTGEVRTLYNKSQTVFHGDGAQKRAVRNTGIVLDITENKRREANLAFLNEVSQDLAHLTHIDPTMAEIGAKIGAHFDASICAFSEVDEAQGTTTTTHEWRRTPDVPSWEGTRRIPDYHTEAFREACRAGETYVVRDAVQDTRTVADIMVLMNVGSFVSVPLVRGGQWRFQFTIADTRPRDWRPDQIELMREIITRVWTRLERAHTEAALRASEEKYRTLFDSIDEGFCTIEVLFDDAGKAVDYRFLETNPAFVRQTGLENVVGKTVRELLPVQEDFWFETYGAVAKTGQARRFEHAADALQRFYDVYAFRIGEAGENRIALIFNDIAPRKQIEEALRQSEARLTALLAVLPVGVGIVNTEGNFIFANRQMQQYLPNGIMPSRDPGGPTRWRASLPDGTLLAPEEFPGARALRGEPALPGIEMLHTRDDGTEIWTQVGSLPISGDAGQIIGQVVVIIDIDTIKRTEVALRESEERFRLLVEGAKDYAMFLLDLEARITFWSAGAERIFGWSAEEAVGQSGEIVFTPEDRAANLPRAETATSLAQGRAPDRRWHVRKDGSRFWADGIMMRIDDADGTVRGFAKVARDATTQKRAEDAIVVALETIAQTNEELEQRVRERTEELEQISRMRQELLRQLVTAQEDEAARISRDLHDDTGQQVTGLLLNLRNLKNRPALRQDAEAQQILARAETLTGEIAQKSHRLSFTLRPTALDDQGLVPALRNYTDEWSKWSGLPVDFISIGLDEERLPKAIETTVYRIAQEALTNILKYATGDDKATQVSITLRRAPTQLVAIVEDNGPGFDAEAQLNPATGKRRLGLFGMQERARLAGGTLTIESAPGEGTTIFLRIPLAP